MQGPSRSAIQPWHEQLDFGGRSPGDRREFWWTPAMAPPEEKKPYFRGKKDCPFPLRLK